VKGFISQVDAESFHVTDTKSGHVTTIAYEDAAKVQKPGMSTGAKIGIGAGVAGGVIVALVFANVAYCNEHACP